MGYCGEESLMFICPNERKGVLLEVAVAALERPQPLGLIRRQSMASNNTINPNGFKKCTKCGKEYPTTAEYFPARKLRNSVGFHSWCRFCHRVAKKEYREKNLEKEQAKARDYFKKHPDYRREYQEKNREKFLEYGRKWSHNNLEKVAEKARKRRARKLQAEGTHSVADIALQLEAQNGRCWWCGKPLGDSYHVDHRIPLSRGGSDAPGNLCISCPSCNVRKSDKMPWEWKGRLL